MGFTKLRINKVTTSGDVIYVNVGYNVGLTSDYYGNSVGASPDIGIFEYGANSGITYFLYNNKYAMYNGKFVMINN